MNETLKTLRERRSVRRYRPEQIKPEGAGGDSGRRHLGPPPPWGSSPPSWWWCRTGRPSRRCQAQCRDPGRAGDRPLLWSAHRGGGAGRGGQRRSGRLSGDGQPDERRLVPGGGLPAGLTGPGSSLSGLRARALLRKWGLPEDSRGWATASWATPTVRSRRRRPEKRGILSGPEDGAPAPADVFEYVLIEMERVFRCRGRSSPSAVPGVSRRRAIKYPRPWRSGGMRERR